MSSKIFQHHNYKECLAQFNTHLTSNSNGKFIVIIGLAGSGKTTLRRTALRNYVLDPLMWGAGKIPIIELTTLLADKCFFNPKWFAQACVNQLIAPNISWYLTDEMKLQQEYIEFMNQINESREIIIELNKIKSTEPQIWNNYINQALLRGLEILSIEHADAMCTLHKDETSADYIQNLMSVNVEVGSTTILTCVESGFRLWEGRQEIRERMKIIFLMPYDLSIKFEMEQYLTLLKFLCKEYIFDPPDLPIKMAIDIAVVTATAPRAISNLLVSAKLEAAMRGRSFIMQADIESCYATNKDIEILQCNVKALRDAKQSCDSEIIKKYRPLWSMKK